MMTVASAIIVHAFVTNNYAIKYVDRYSDAAQPLFYKITSYWGGLDGSVANAGVITAGTWDTTMKLWMEPGAEPMVSTGTSTNTMILGGRQLKMEYSGTFMDMPFMGIGFTGFDTFFFYLHMLGGMYGSVPGFERFLQDNGFDKITGIFSAYPSATKYTAPHVRETHDRIIADSTNTLRMCEGLTGVENFIVMPTSTYYQTEPVTDDTIKEIDVASETKEKEILGK